MLFRSLGYHHATILTTAEIPIAVLVLGIVAATVFIKENAAAFWIQHLAIVVGCCVVMVSTYLFEYRFISPVMWMISVGFGLYLAYILFQSLIFERLIAAFKEVGNVGFLMYVADAFGYLGSVGIMFLKNFGAKTMAWSAFFIQASYVVSLSGIFLIFISFVYFYQKYEYRKITFHTNDMMADIENQSVITSKGL